MFSVRLWPDGSQGPSQFSSPTASFTGSTAFTYNVDGYGGSASCRSSSTSQSRLRSPTTKWPTSGGTATTLPAPGWSPRRRQANADGDAPRAAHRHHRPRRQPQLDPDGSPATSPRCWLTAQRRLDNGDRDRGLPKSPHVHRLAVQWPRGLNGPPRLGLHRHRTMTPLALPSLDAGRRHSSSVVPMAW